MAVDTVAEVHRTCRLVSRSTDGYIEFSKKMHEAMDEDGMFDNIMRQSDEVLIKKTIRGYYYLIVQGDVKMLYRLIEQFKYKKDVIDFENVARDFLDFAGRTFTVANAETALMKTQKEIKETIEKLNGHRDELIEEYADVFLTLLVSLQKAEFTVEELVMAMHKKTQKNKSRTWEVLGDGTYQHIKNKTA